MWLLLLLASLVASSSTPLVIGHRGMGAGNASVPENSIPALIAGLEAGADLVELDAQLAADGEVIVAHDPHLDRISAASGCVESETSAALGKIPLRDGNGAIHGDVFIPTLRDALTAAFEHAGARRFVANIHIKVYDGLHGDWAGFKNKCPRTDHAELARKVVAITEELGVSDRVIYTSFDSRVLDLIEAHDPRLVTGYLSIYYPVFWAIHRARGRYDAIVMAHKLVTPHAVEHANRAGLRLLAWTVDDRAELEKLLSKRRLDGVITDDVATALELRP